MYCTKHETDNCGAIICTWLVPKLLLHTHSQTMKPTVTTIYQLLGTLTVVTKPLCLDSVSGLV